MKLKDIIMQFFDDVGLTLIELVYVENQQTENWHQRSSLVIFRTVALVASVLIFTAWLVDPAPNTQGYVKQEKPSDLVMPECKTEPKEIQKNLPEKGYDIRVMLDEIGLTESISNADILTGDAVALRDEDHPLGWLSSAKESHGRDNIISTGRAANGKDAGGISYGRHQIATKTGTMSRWIESNEAKPFRASLKKYPINSKPFKTTWLKLSTRKDFLDAQFDFLKRTHFDRPLNYATKAGFNTGSPLIQEAIFSMGIHSGAGGWNKKKKKWTGAIGVLHAVANHNNLQELTTLQQLKLIYVARWLRTRHGTNSKRHYKIRMDRYKSEFEMLLSWGGVNPKNLTLALR